MVMPHMPGSFMGSIASELHAMPLWKVKEFFPNAYEREKKRRANAKASKSSKKSKSSKR